MRNLDFLTGVLAGVLAGVLVMSPTGGEALAIATDRASPASENSVQERQQIIEIAAAIREADYAGDRAELQRLHEQLDEAGIEDRHLVSRVRYWRGFAMWRRALNGFNESEAPEVLEADLDQAIADFRAAQALDTTFADAMAGEASCLSNLAFLIREDNSARARELLLQSWGLLAIAASVAPENARVRWVLGTQQWYTPSGWGGGQANAFATYQRGLELVRSEEGGLTDRLEPSWGEPELLMSLAFANLNRTTPDPAAAERYAEAALELVPDWHYVREILLVQIRDAMGAGGQGRSGYQ
ncbi:MAG: hypothetical protein RQ847_04255 [Wenzhouxiangellaceae bacterium]|nr:hypothetical protein [Wenzhouxiangellaceae bacterium]